MTLREKRCLFTDLICRLQTSIRVDHPNWFIAFDEFRIITPRAVRYKGERITVEDGIHKPNSYHYSGLAVDYLLYINGQDPDEIPDYVADQGHDFWFAHRVIADRWKEMNENCTAGYYFPKPDPNHLSFGEGK